MNDTIEEIRKAIGEETINELQESVSELLEIPQFRQYAKQGKLGLLDSRYRTIDQLISLGILKV